MSKLEHLIEDLCPDGVEYASLDSLFNRAREKGKNDKKVSQVYAISNTSGMVKAEDFRKNAIHSNDTSNYTIVRPNMVVYNPSRLNIGSIAMLKSSIPGLVSPMYVVISVDNNKICYSYFEYLMKSSYIMNKIDSYKEEGARFRFDYSRWSRIEVPLPSLPIQEEIVRILDNFTELTARKKQYEYYRDELLTFGDEVEWKTLGGVASNTYSGGTPRANTSEYYNNGGIPWLRTQEVVFNDIYDTEIKITEKAIENSSAKWIPKNCVIVAISGATAGRSAINKIPLTTNQHCFCIDINPKIALYRYVFHWVSSNYENLKSLGRGARGDLNGRIISNFEIPIPPLSKQERIVSILDKFDALVNDISIGLPAEIEARQKQYEYYREKLLTFKEKEA